MRWKIHWLNCCRFSPVTWRARPELAVSEMEVNGQRMFTGIVRDITERKRAEAALKASENHIRVLVDTIVDGIIVIDANGCIQTFNPAAEILFGYHLDEVLGLNVKVLMPKPFAREHDGYLHKYLTTGSKKIIGIGREVTGRRKDGSTFPMELAARRLGRACEAQHFPPCSIEPVVLYRSFVDVGLPASAHLSCCNFRHRRLMTS